MLVSIVAEPYLSNTLLEAYLSFFASAISKVVNLSPFRSATILTKPLSHLCHVCLLLAF